MSDWKPTYSRKQYLAKVCTHDEYYGQFLTPHLVNHVAKHFGISRLVEAYRLNESLSHIPLAEWDGYGQQLLHMESARRMGLATMTKSTGVSMAELVCLGKRAAKEAVRQKVAG